MRTIENKTRSPESEFIVLYGVPWETYEGILDALGEYHLRHTYDEGTLEMRRVLYGVAWEDYLKLLDATPYFYLRHTYDEGTLEMLGPRKDHDWVAKLLARMIEAFPFASNTPIQSIGSTTIRAAKGGRGLQPDQTYYLANEPLVRGKDTYDPKKDPPDLAVEIDVTNTSVPRLPVFAKIGVPEVWRLDERGRLRFYRLAKGKYGAVEHSIAFAFLKAADVMRFVNRRGEIGENAVVRGFVEWAQKGASEGSKALEMIQTVLPSKSEIAAFCRRHGIRKLSLFGSVLREDFRPDSDVDVLVDFQPGRVVGFDIFDMEEELSQMFGGHRVDIISEKYLNRRLRGRILASAEVQYAEG